MPVFPAGYRLAERNETGSTNADCLDAARAGEAGGLWIRAHRQTAGRGSRGRDWVSEPGNLFTSLLLDVPPQATKLPTLTFVTSLALADTVTALGQEVAVRTGASLDVSLKWPNDVLLNGKKLAGILLESHQLADRSIVIVGIGLNCTSHPPSTNYPATDLRTEGLDAHAGQVLALLATQLNARLKQWDWGRGLAATRRDWLALAAGLGEIIEVRIGAASHRGTFETIDETGLLVLRDGEGQQREISVADIFLSQPAIAVN